MSVRTGKGYWDVYSGVTHVARFTSMRRLVEFIEAVKQVEGVK